MHEKENNSIIVKTLNQLEFTIHGHQELGESYKTFKVQESLIDDIIINLKKNKQYKIIEKKDENLLYIEW